MKQYKSTIIRKYGTTVNVKRFYDKGVDERETKALLGRGTRNNVNMFKLATQKEGIFLPDFDVVSGDYVENKNHNEMYVVVGTHQEYDGNRTLSIVTNLLKCDYKATIKGHTRTTDSRGNLKSVFGDKYVDVPCYVEKVSANLRQYEPGLHPETEHKVYLTDIDVTEVDQLVLNINGRDKPFKVLTTDYISFPNLLVLEIGGDIRK